MSWYISIKPNSLAEYLPPHNVAKYLNQLAELKQRDNCNWQSSTTNFFTVGVYLENETGYISDGKLPEKVNLIEIIGDYVGDPTAYFALAEKIAGHFNWRVIEQS